MENENVFRFINNPRPINISFFKENEKIGEFTEEDGNLTFKGDVTESGQKFVDYICNTFNERINELVKNKIKENNIKQK